MEQGLRMIHWTTRGGWGLWWKGRSQLLSIHHILQFLLVSGFLLQIFFCCCLVLRAEGWALTVAGSRKQPTRLKTSLHQSSHTISFWL